MFRLLFPYDDELYRFTWREDGTIDITRFRDDEIQREIASVPFAAGTRDDFEQLIGDADVIVAEDCVPAQLDVPGHPLHEKLAVEANSIANRMRELLEGDEPLSPQRRELCESILAATRVAQRHGLIFVLIVIRRTQIDRLKVVAICAG